MSKSECTDQIGYGRPPRAHRFSAENQPRRRRKGAKGKLGSTHDLHGYLMEALSEEVAVSQNGKAGKAKVMAAFTKMLVNQVCKGPVADQIRFMTYLNRSGLLEVMKLKDRLEEELQERLAEGAKDLSDALELSLEALKVANELNQRVSVATGEYLMIKNKCTCGAFEKCTAISEQLEQWHSDAQHEIIPNGASTDRDGSWAPRRSAYAFEDPTDPCAETEIDASFSVASKSLNARDTDYDRDDPFYSGMLGNH